jgi:hypothetical protein
MYMRLRAPGKLYADGKVAHFLNRILSQSDGQQALGDVEAARLTLGWQVRTLLSLLAWRAQETLLAEWLAHTTQVPADRVLAWGVKESASGIAHWINGTNPLTIYLSHPITEARRFKRERGDWPEFTHEINGLQHLLDDLNITLVAPTGIDELRFRMDGINPTGALEPRWPLPDEPSLYGAPPANDDIGGAPDYVDLLTPRRWTSGRPGLLKRIRVHRDDEAWIAASVQPLVREIEAQISARDLFLVYHTDGLLVYRPLFNTGAPRALFSSGVEEEVRLWSELCKVGLQRRMAVLHLTSEVQAMAELRRSQNLGNLTMLWLAEIRRQFHVTLDMDTAQKLVQGKGAFEDQERLLRQHQLPQESAVQIQRFMEERWNEVKLRLLETYLLGDVVRLGEERIDVLRLYWGIWVVDDLDAVAPALREIAEFFHARQPSSNDWGRHLPALLPDPT